MAPLYLKLSGLRVVTRIFLTIHGTEIADKESTVIFVSFLIVGGSLKSPASLGVDLSEQLQIHLIADGEIISSVAQIESLRHLVTISRHDKSTAIALCKREESVRYSQWQRHIGHHEVGRSEHHVFSRTHLCPRHCYIEVGMRVVTGGIASVLKKHLSIATSLGFLTGQVSVFLLGIHIGDKTLLRLEVERHLLLLILIATHLEHRRTHHLICGRVEFS